MLQHSFSRVNPDPAANYTLSHQSMHRHALVAAPLLDEVMRCPKQQEVQLMGFLWLPCARAAVLLLLWQGCVLVQLFQALHPRPSLAPAATVSRSAEGLEWNGGLKRRGTGGSDAHALDRCGGMGRGMANYRMP